MAEDVKQTIIEKGTEIDGTIKSERAIVLSGSVKGQISAPSLEVTPSGKVNGKIKVSQFSCSGEVGGEVTAEVVALGGRVCDATVIRAKTLDVKLAQSEKGVEVTFGNCELHVGDVPARATAKPGAVSAESSKMVASAQNVATEVIDAVSHLIK